MSVSSARQRPLRADDAELVALRQRMQTTSNTRGRRRLGHRDTVGIPLRHRRPVPRVVATTHRHHVGRRARLHGISGDRRAVRRVLVPQRPAGRAARGTTATRRARPRTRRPRVYRRRRLDRRRRVTPQHVAGVRRPSTRHGHRTGNRRPRARRRRPNTRGVPGNRYTRRRRRHGRTATPKTTVPWTNHGTRRARATTTPTRNASARENARVASRGSPYAANRARAVPKCGQPATTGLERRPSSSTSAPRRRPATSHRPHTHTHTHPGTVSCDFRRREKRSQAARVRRRGPEARRHPKSPDTRGAVGVGYDDSRPRSSSNREAGGETGAVAGIRMTTLRLRLPMSPEFGRRPTRRSEPRPH